jgi:hypothetical protein
LGLRLGLVPTAPGQSPHLGRHIGRRKELGHKLLYLPFGFAARAPEHLLGVVLSQVRSQQAHPAQVQLTLVNQLEDERKAPRRSRGGYPLIACTLGEPQYLDAVGEHRWAGRLSVEPAGIDLTEVS